MPLIREAGVQDLQIVVSLVTAAGKFLYTVLATHASVTRQPQFVAEGEPKGIVSKIVMVAHPRPESLSKDQDKHHWAYFSIERDKIMN